MSARIKRGTTFVASITFTPDEWAELYPWTSIEAEAGQGSRRYPLTVATDVATRTIILTATAAATATWVTTSGGAASFDVLVTRGAERIAIPASSNVPFSVIEGVTL